MHHAGRVPRHRSALRRPFFGLGATLIALLALLTAIPEPASGAPSDLPASHWPPSHPASHWRPSHPDHHWRPSHPDHHWMGSTVAAHEGRTANTGSTVGSHVTRTLGFDVSGWQDAIDWKAAYKLGARFAYIKATEGTSYRDPSFNANYTNSYNAGFIRGAYHFATPNSSSAKAQADYFVAHGGDWSKDGKTLPPMVDIEYNPNGDSCYGLSKTAMTNWISAFIKEIHAKTTRWATIYTTDGWWKTCTGNTGAFSANNPLFLARFASTAGTLPSGWPFYTFWQYADSGAFPGDQDYFNGPLSGLKNLANNT